MSSRFSCTQTAVASSPRRQETFISPRWKLKMLETTPASFRVPSQGRVFSPSSSLSSHWRLMMVSPSDAPQKQPLLICYIMIYLFFYFASGEERKYPADIRVKFPDTTAMLASNITLECFALGKYVLLVLLLVYVYLGRN